MSYKLGSLDAMPSGYYRVVFEPCTKKFVVDIPTKELTQFFSELSELDQTKPFDVQIRKKSGCMTNIGYRETYDLRLGRSNFYINDVLPVKEVEVEEEDEEDEVYEEDEE